MDDFDKLLSEAAEATKPSLDGLGRVSALADEMFDLEQKIKLLNAEAKTLQDQLTIMSERDMPLLFDELGLRDFTLKNGHSVKIKPTYIGKIDSDRKDEAYEWLESNGYGGMVKTAVEARFGMGDLEKAKELSARLENDGYVVNVGQSVHPATLGKFIKTRYVEGKEIPDELFHPNILRRAQIV